MKIVLDTNILLVSISPSSKYHWIFRKFLNEEYQICVTNEILTEYEEIIGRYMGPQIAHYILQILENAVNTHYITTYYRWNLITADPDDNKFVDCAVAANARYIVTNDKRFDILKNIDFPQIELLNLAEFKALME